ALRARTFAASWSPPSASLPITWRACTTSTSRPRTLPPAWGSTSAASNPSTTARPSSTPSRPPSSKLSRNPMQGGPKPVFPVNQIDTPIREVSGRFPLGPSTPDGEAHPDPGPGRRAVTREVLQRPQLEALHRGRRRDPAADLAGPRAQPLGRQAADRLRVSRLQRLDEAPIELL